ncbi:MAG: J domain-containing protein [Clostridia bacterium]|nr:J domain-containing protein [Clostridia bacterium]
MIFKNYYKILGLENNKVSKEEIKIAFREQAKKYHPDVNGGNTRTEERFKDINEAYRVLSDSATKRKYDRMWNRHVGSKIKQDYEESKRSKDSVFSDFFNMFFGASNEQDETSVVRTKKKNPVKGENIETEINVGIEDAYYGTEKKISLRTVERKNENIFCKNSRRN